MARKQYIPRIEVLEINRRRQEEILGKRKIVRSAFFLVRHNQLEADAVDRLAGALSGRYPLDQYALDLARNIIAKFRHQ